MTSTILNRNTLLFFKKTTFYQLKDVASGVLAGEKATSLAELFSEELKFTVDTFNDLVFKHYKTGIF